MKKKKQWKRYAPTFLFCIFIAVMMVLFFALPKQSFSSNEKRVLEETPSFTLGSLADGSYGKSVENYLSDHFPGRNFFVGLNSYYNLYSGRNGSSDVYLGKDGYLINAPITWNEENLQKNLDHISTLAQQVSAPVAVSVVPSTGYIMEDKLPAVHKPYHDQEILQEISSSLDSNIQYIDLQQAFQEQASKQQLYYKTDHHWTSAGAYLGYQVLGQQLGFTPTERDLYQVEASGGFYGTTYSHSGYWLSAPDTVEMWHNPQLADISVRIEETGKDPVESDSMFFPSHLEEEDKYPVFLDGNHGYTKITNPGAPLGKLLLIKDSFGHCLAPFLAEQYQEIYMIDLRYYKNSLTELAEQEGTDQVLFLYGLDNMVNDTNFVWIK